MNKLISMIRSFTGWLIVITFVAGSVGCAGKLTRNPLPSEFTNEAVIPGVPEARFWGDEWPKYSQEKLAEFTDEIFSESTLVSTTNPTTTSPYQAVVPTVPLGQACWPGAHSIFAHQYTAELFWRFQLTTELAITPSIQYIKDPALNPEEDSLWAFGLRARLAL